MGTIRIGISGWRYEPWRGIFYPKELVQRRELEFASRAFPTIEINGSFYSLQTPRSYATWHGETPDAFVFSIKAPRYITHVLRLQDIEGALANFLASGVFNLKEKLGPILWQFPPSLRYDRTLFDQFLALLPHDTERALAVARKRESWMRGRTRLAIDRNRPLRHVIEIRHPGFATESFIDLLRGHRVALVVADTAGKWPYLEDVTTDFMYLRLHGDEELYASGYTETALDRWADRIKAWAAGREPTNARRIGGPTSNRDAGRDVYCYFDNDIKVRAPFDADQLMRKLDLKRSDATFRFPDRKVLRHIRPVVPLPSWRWQRRAASTKPKPSRS